MKIWGSLEAFTEQVWTSYKKFKKCPICGRGPMSIMFLEQNKNYQTNYILDFTYSSNNCAMLKSWSNKPQVRQDSFYLNFLMLQWHQNNAMVEKTAKIFHNQHCTWSSDTAAGTLWLCCISETNRKKGISDTNSTKIFTKEQQSVCLFQCTQGLGGQVIAVLGSQYDIAMAGLAALRWHGKVWSMDAKHKYLRPHIHLSKDIQWYICTHTHARTRSHLYQTDSTHTHIYNIQTFTVLVCYHWWELAHIFCRNRCMLAVTKFLSQQNYVCRDKIFLLQQNFCCDKTFVMTSILLS